MTRLRAEHHPPAAATAKQEPSAGEYRTLPPQESFSPAVCDAAIRVNRHLADRYWLLRLDASHVAATARPGQFVMLTVTRDPRRGPVLPRPMAIYDTDLGRGEVDIVYSVVGAGTRELSRLGRGEQLVTVGPAGRGFHVPDTGDLLLIGRGIGTCSLTLLATTATGRVVTAVASGRNPGAIVGTDLYTRSGATCLPVHDDDGSSDRDALYAVLRARFDARPPALIATCGSARLEALAADLGDIWDTDVQVSLEAHMACGLGYCHGCAAGAPSATRESPLICRDGPVFRTPFQTKHAA